MVSDCGSAGATQPPIVYSCNPPDLCSGQLSSDAVSSDPGCANWRSFIRRHRKEMSRTFAARVRFPLQQVSVSRMCSRSTSASVQPNLFNASMPPVPTKTRETPALWSALLVNIVLTTPSITPQDGPTPLRYPVQLRSCKQTLTSNPGTRRG